MNTHAVPQEIMSVDFKLFGNFLSLREFLFIASGLAIAWFFWFLMQQGVIPGLIAVPISFIVGGGGILMGLVPINDKSLDKWILTYFSAIKRPTQRVWRKTGYRPEISTSDSLASAKDYVVTPPSASTGVFSSVPIAQSSPKGVDSATINAETAEIEDLKRLDSSFAKLGQPSSVPQQKQEEYPSSAAQFETTIMTDSSQSDMPAINKPTVSSMSSFSASEAPLSNPQLPSTRDLSGTIILDSGQSEATSPEHTAPTSDQVRPNELSGTVSFPAQPQNSVANTQYSASATSQPSRFSDGPFPPGITMIPPSSPGNVPLVNPQKTEPAEKQMPPFPASQQAPAQTHVIVVDDKNIGDYATTIPGLEDKTNTINVVVKDAKGLIMPGVVCVIKNAHGDPVRAAISNILGQIINNIPLKDGMYKVSLTKQGYLFPEVTRSLTGKIYSPIEIKSL